MSFASDVEKWTKKTGLSVDRAITAACVDISTEIIDRTPVDSGRLRGNWVPSTGAPELNTSDNTAPLYAEVAKEAERAPGSVFYLVNNLPYVRRIEYEGWSKVKAPQGMVRVSILGFRAAIEKEVNK